MRSPVADTTTCAVSSREMRDDRMKRESAVECGLMGIGLYLPENVRTAAEIAELSGVPEEVVRHKFGINRIYYPGENDQTSDMAVRAAMDCLGRIGVDPAEIDLVIYFGENYSDYQVFSIAPKVIGAIGAVNAWGYDMECKCGSFVVALDQAKKYMLCEDIDTVMVVGGYRNVDKVDYKNVSVSFLFDVSCAGAAAIIRKGYPRRVVLENANMADGRFAESVYVPGGGSKHPFNASNINNDYLKYFHVNDPKGFREKLGAISLKNLVKVTEQACLKSGLSVGDIDFACPLHMKISAHLQLLRDLNIPEEKSFYLSDFGHAGQLDAPISLRMAEERHLIQPGDIIAVIAMGFGYVWNAGIIRW